MCFSMISALNPDKMHGDLAHAAARQRFRSDGKRRRMAHDARSRTSRRVRDTVRPDGTCRSENGDRRGAGHPFAASEGQCQRAERYLEMEQSDAGFRRPISYGEIRAADFDALILTGGHAPGMRVY